MSVYPGLQFPRTESNRPYVVLNMVSTIDGKIVSGQRSEHVMDLGSQRDHETLRAMEQCVDAIILGAGSLRATPGLHYPSRNFHIVVSASGNLDFESKFFRDDPAKTILVTGQHFVADVGHKCVVFRFSVPFDWPQILELFQSKFSIKTLLLEGGSELNASFFASDLVDEIFLTIAPKIKGGTMVPTIAGGNEFGRDALLLYDLVSATPIGHEVFLRYRRKVLKS